MSKRTAASLAWVPFYASDWLGSPFVSGLSFAAQGLYFRALAAQAASQSGTLPGDLEQLRRALGADPDEWAELWPAIRERFEQAGSDLVEPRMRAVWEDHRERAERLRVAGRAGALARWGNATAHATASPQPQGSECDGTSDRTCDGNASQSQSQSQSQSKSLTAHPPTPLSGEARGKRARKRRRAPLLPDEIARACSGIPQTAVVAWQRYRREAGLRAWVLGTWAKAWKAQGADPERFAAAVDNSIANGYQGLFPRGGSQRSDGRATKREREDGFLREFLAGDDGES